MHYFEPFFGYFDQTKSPFVGRGAEIQTNMHTVERFDGIGISEREPRRAAATPASSLASRKMLANGNVLQALHRKKICV